MKNGIAFLLFLAATATLNLARADSTQVVKGKVTAKNEIWNRRSNPLMGRPDWLEEIRLTLEVESVMAGERIQAHQLITLSIRQQSMLAHNELAVGDQTTFTCQWQDSLFAVLEYHDLIKAPPVPEPPAPVRNDTLPPKQPNLLSLDSLTAAQVIQLLETPDYISGKLIQKFENLRVAALQKYSAMLKLSQAEVITLVSFSGPAVPDGGYVYWGIRGMRNGKWQIWQPGYGVRDGRELHDPGANQK